MKKALIIVTTIIIFIVIIVYVIFPKVMMFSINKFNEEVSDIEGKTIEIYDVETFDEYVFIDNLFKKQEILEVEAYYTPDTILFGLGVQNYHVSGNLVITKEYYDELLNKYNDWQTISGFPDTSNLAITPEIILEDADKNFIDFIQNNEYYYSQECLEDNGWLILLSKEENRVYFYDEEI